MPEILLTISVISSATGSTTARSTNPAANRFQNPTTYTLGASRRPTLRWITGALGLVVSLLAWLLSDFVSFFTNGVVLASSRAGGVPAGASTSTAGSRSDIVNLYG